TRDEMYVADEAFFTGTAAEITPIRELDDRPIGDGRRGPITEKLQTLFFDIVAGRNERYRPWLMPICARPPGNVPKAQRRPGPRLPAHSPNPKMPLWSGHPRVYIHVTRDGRGRCPYCGTVYVLKPGAAVDSH